MPNPRGFRSRVNLDFGGYVASIYQGQLARFIGGETTDYEAFAEVVRNALRRPDAGGDKAWALLYDQTRRLCRNQDRLLAVQSTRMLMDSEARDAPAKYRRALLQQVLLNNGGEHRRRFEQLRKRPIPEI